jgi:serine/threonine protein kinase
MWADESSSELQAGEFIEKRLEYFFSAWERNHGRLNDSTLIPKYNDDDFCFQRRIGQGNFCNVYSVSVNQAKEQPSICNEKWRKKRTEPEYALKRLQERFHPGTILFKVAAADIAIETTILSNLTHENIVVLHGVKTGDMIESISEGTFFLVLDFLVETLDARLGRWQTKQNRSILQSIANKRVNVLKRISNAAFGVAKGMEYLHSLSIIFR